MRRALVVMGKLPRPGRVKTRLTPPLVPAAASRLYRAFLADVFAVAERARREVDFDPLFACALAAGDSLADARALAPAGWRVLAQEGSDLGRRIDHARRAAAAPAVVVVGSDSPTMLPERIVEAFRAVQGGATVFGPTDDGGYYLVGLGDDGAELLEGIPWSTGEVMAATRARAGRLGLGLVELAQGYDVDRAEDLERAARDATALGATHTARALAELGYGRGNAGVVSTPGPC